jgi:glucosamine-6-phosphate deaminase
LPESHSHQGLLAVAGDEFGAAALAVFRHALAGIEQPVIGLPTGRTPVALYQEMAREGFVFPEGSRLFAIDEYCSVQPHPGTNTAFFQQYLPSPPYPPIRVPAHDAANPEAEIAQLSAELAAAGGFDVAVLGIGMNGHIAFNEPGSSPQSPGRVVALAPATRSQVANEWHPAPTHGLTIGMAELLSARRVILLARGAAKADILAAALDGPVTSDVPASFLQNHRALTVVCDLLAGSHLRSETRPPRPMDTASAE